MDNEYLLPQVASEVAMAIGKALSSVQSINGVKPDAKTGDVELHIPDFYSTTREELEVTLGIEGATYEKITSARVWGLYNALMAKYPDRVQKNEIHNNDGTFTNYEYVISTGEYNTKGEGAKRWGDKNIKKPKYLLLSGVHGYEESAILSVYRFIRDVLEGHNIPAQFREGCSIHVFPVGNPYSLDNHRRGNENQVSIGGNFDWYTTDEWDTKGSKKAEAFDEEGKENVWAGPSAASEKETQAIQNWLVANKEDAEMFFDCHTTLQYPNEMAWFVGLANNEEYDRSKKIALRGVGRVIPFWRDVIGYAEDTVYPISTLAEGTGYPPSYASEVVGIPSLSLELSGLQNGIRPDGVNAYNDPITPETVSAGAEVIGNALIEFYEYALNGEVVDMTETNEKIDAFAESTNGKLDALLQSVGSGFRVETGVYTAEEDAGVSINNKTAIVELPCKGVKILVFTPDDDTSTSILATTSGTWLVGFVGQALKKIPYMDKNYLQCGGYLSNINDGTLVNTGAMIIDADNGAKFGVAGIKAGTYNWTAYYWND